MSTGHFWWLALATVSSGACAEAVAVSWAGAEMLVEVDGVAIIIAGALRHVKLGNLKLKS